MHFGSNNLIATSHPDGKIRILDTRQQEEASKRGSYGESNARMWISTVKWAPESVDSNNVLFASADYDGKVILWDLRTTVPLGSNEMHSGKVLCLDWLVDSSGTLSALTGGSDCTIKSVDVSLPK